jgi:hypothetical protein
MKGISEISQIGLKRTLLTLTAVALVGASCSFPDPTSDAPSAEVDFDSGEKGEAEERPEAKKGGVQVANRSHKEKRRIVRAFEALSPDAGVAGGPTRDRKSGKDGGGQDGGGPGPATATTKFGGELQKPGRKKPRSPGPGATVSRLKDPVPDAETRGDAPDYIEIAESSVTGSSKSALFSVTFTGPLPGRMPNNETVTYMSFSLQRKGRNFSVNASCERDGWRANVNGGKTFPGGFSIRGKTLSMSVPWKSIGGNKAFGWRVDSSWTRSNTLDTYYGLDSAPNDQDKRYR